jgi:hypothetical protein
VAIACCLIGQIDYVLASKTTRWVELALTLSQLASMLRLDCREPSDTRGRIMADTAHTIIDNVVSKFTLAHARAIAWGEKGWGRIVRSQKRLMLAGSSSANVRVFHLLRDEDPSGVSGVGRVAVGVVFPSGKVVLEWLGSNNTFGVYDDISLVEHIHGHGGKTRIVFTRGAMPNRASLVQVQAWQKAPLAVGASEAVNRQVESAG